MTLMGARAPSFPTGRRGDVYDEMKRHEVRVLREAGFPLREVARRAKVSLDTVLRILGDGAPFESHVTPVGRPPVARRFEDIARRILEERPELPTVEVLRLLREKGYTGSKTPAYELVRGLRKTLSPPIVLFSGLAGEFCQNDFGQVRVKYDDGTEEIIHFFASRLKFSRWVHVELVPNEQVESLVRAFLNALQSFGGVPLGCVFDNPKTIVIARYGEHTVWNETFAQVIVDYGFATVLCTPRRGNEKGSVENLVGFVKNGFFKVRRFHDRADLESQLAQWHHEVNYERPCRATKVIPAARIEEERKRLRPLPIPPSEYPLRFPVRVGPTATVSFQGAIYSMPAEAMGANATLLLYPKKVRIIVSKKIEASHDRKSSGGVSTLPKHATSVLAQRSGERAQNYYKRQRLLETGPPAEAFMTNLVHAHPFTWMGDVNTLFDLWLEHGPLRMAQAFQTALEKGWYGTESIERWLRKGVGA